MRRHVGSLSATRGNEPFGGCGVEAACYRVFTQWLLTVGEEGADLPLCGGTRIVSANDANVPSTGVSGDIGAHIKHRVGVVKKEPYPARSVIQPLRVEYLGGVDAENLCEWVYTHEISYQLANSPETTTLNGIEVPVAAEVAHAGWIDTTVKATLRDPAAAVTIFDLNGNVSQSLEFDELTGNVKEGDKVGTITFKQRNAVIATMDLVACEDVDAPNFFEGVGVWWDRLFRGFSGAQQVAQSITLNETPLVVDKTASAA